VNNTHVKQFTEKKNAEIHLHTAGALQKYNQALELCSRAAFEDVMPWRQKNTWAFHDPDSSPCSLCCVPQILQTHWQSFQWFSTFFTPFRKFPVRNMKCSCVCTIENHNDYKITYNITMLNHDSFVKFMHMAASMRETRTVHKSLHSTAH